MNLKKKLSCLKIYFKHGSYGVVPFGCIQVYHVIRLNTHMTPLWGFPVWNKFSDRIFFFQIYIKFSNFKTRFEISNKFKRIFETYKFWPLMKRQQISFEKLPRLKLPVNPSAFGILIDIVVKILIRTRSKITSRDILPVTISVGTQGIVVS